MGKLIEICTHPGFNPQKESPEIIEGFDLDGTLYGREWPIEYWGALLGRILPQKLPPYTLDNLPDLDRTPKHTKFHNHLNHWFHMRRRALPGVKDRLDRKKAQGKTLFGISGRPNIADWVYGSYKQLDREGLPIEKLILTPKGTKGMVSKAEAIQANNISRFADDDLRVILYLNDLFPDINLDYIMGNPTNIPVDYQELLKRPNIRIVLPDEWMDPNFD